MNAKDVWQQSDTTMTKILILECIDTNFTQSYQVKIPYDSQHRELDLGYSLHHILHNKLQFHSEHQIFYFHPREQLFQFAGVYPFKYPLLIGQDFIGEQEISVRVRRVITQNHHPQQVIKEVKEKKKRIGTRTIRQVLAKVSEWREISQKNSKITLEEGAKIVGIPKKTLDDYYAHLKLGTQFNFDFKLNLQQKIGVLRQFVRDKSSKKKQEHQFQFLNDLIKEESPLDSDQQEEQQE